MTETPAFKLLYLCEVMHDPIRDANLYETAHRCLTLEALGRHDWAQSKAARLLGITRRAISYNTDKYAPHSKPGVNRVVALSILLLMAGMAWGGEESIVLRWKP